jgi:hypothetical protein
MKIEKTKEKIKMCFVAAKFGYSTKENQQNCLAP